MKLSVKKISYLFAGVVVLTAVFIFAKLNVANAVRVDGKKFGDWYVSCSPADDKAKTPEICLLNQQVNITNEKKEQQPIAIFQLAYVGPKKELNLVLTLPLGVRLEPGTSIISSKKLIVPGKYTTCTANGCQAVAAVSDSDLKAVLATADNAVAFMSYEGKQMILPFSAKGLDEGLNYIK